MKDEFLWSFDKIVTIFLENLCDVYLFGQTSVDSSS